MPRAKVDQSQVNALGRKQGRRCQACGTRRSIELDHVVPVAAGGSDDPSNLQWLCSKHNREKGTKVVDYRSGWRSWPLVRLSRRLDALGENAMIRAVCVLLVRVVCTVALIGAALLWAPILVPHQVGLQVWAEALVLDLWHVLQSYMAIGAAVVLLLVLGTWYEGRSWVYPDEYGQLPYRKSHLKKNPHLAEQRNAQHQHFKIVDVTHRVPHHYAPKFAPGAEAPQLEAVPARVPLRSWLSRVRDYDAHTMLVGGTGDGKSTIARLLEAERAATDKIVIIDPHGFKNDWLGLPVHGDGRNYQEIERTVQVLHAEFNRRYNDRELNSTPLTIFIDEVPAIADNTDNVIPTIKQWVREGRKVGMRLVLLTQGKEVKTLGIEGEGTIRDSFLSLYLGRFAHGVAGNEQAGRYAAAIGQGNGSAHDFQAIDTADVPSVHVTPLDPAVVTWQPSPALLASCTTTTGMLQNGANSTASSSSTGNLTQAQIDHAVQLHDQGQSLAAIQRALFNGKQGGVFHTKVKTVLHHAGRM